MATPITARTNWTNSSSQSTPGVEVEIPSTRASQVPTRAAATPTRMVSQAGMDRDVLSPGEDQAGERSNDGTDDDRRNNAGGGHDSSFSLR